MTAATDRRVPVAERLDADAGTPARARARAARWTSAVPVASARIFAVLGLLAVFGPLWSARWSAPGAVSLLPDPGGAGAQVTVVVVGLVLLRVAAGLRRRKRAAWAMAMAVLVAFSASDLLVARPRPVHAAVAAGLLVVLVVARSRFTHATHARGRVAVVRRGLVAAGAGLAYGLTLLALPGHVAPGTTSSQRVAEVVASMLGLHGPLALHGDRFDDIFHTTSAILGLMIVSVTALLVLRPSLPQRRSASVDGTRLRGLLRSHGARDSLGYFALRDDKDVVWSESGKAAIAYRVVNGVALIGGDPLGDPEAWPGAIDAFQELVDEHGWTPAAIGCSERAALVLQREAGLSALGLGDEAVLSTDDFSLEGRAMRGVRQACNRLTRAGYTVTARRSAEVGVAELDQLRAAADAWRTDGCERGFSMALSRLGDPADPDCVIVTASQDGQLRGLLHFVPWGTDGLSLDLMRRARDADNGVNELMIAAVMADAAGPLGIARVSLNFAVFRDDLERGQRIGAGPVLRLWCRILLLASRYWQIDSLYRFNDKFRPDWQPRFLCFASARDLPRVAVAGLAAEGFLTVPGPLARVLHPLQRPSARTSGA